MYRLIFRNGTQPSSIGVNDFVVIGSDQVNVVTKKSGIPNVPLEKIYTDILGGNVYQLYKVRIEVLSTYSDETRESIVTAPISYKLKTAMGDMANNPIYPLLSTLQQVPLADVSLQDLLINVDSSFIINSIPPFTSVKYSFYPNEEGSSTSTMLRDGETSQEYSEPNLNEISGVESVSVKSCANGQSTAENTSNDTKDDTKEIHWLPLGIGVGIIVGIIAKILKK